MNILIQSLILLLFDIKLNNISDEERGYLSYQLDLINLRDKFLVFCNRQKDCQITIESENPILSISFVIGTNINQKLLAKISSDFKTIDIEEILRFSNEKHHLIKLSNDYKNI
jgi:hypothetical protein